MKIESAKKIAQILFARFRRQTCQVPQRAMFRPELLELMLREVADLQAFALGALTAQRRQRAGQQFHHGRFAGAVAPEQANSGARAQRHLNVTQHGGLAIARVHAVKMEHRIGLHGGLAEREFKRRIHMRGGNFLHASERLDAALRLSRLGGLCLEAIDIGLEVGDFTLLFHKRGLLLGKLHRALGLERRIVSAVQAQPLPFDMANGIRHSIEEFTVVRNHQQRAGITQQPLLQPDDGIQIQVIGGFVEQQQLRTTHECARQIQPHPPATGKLRDRSFDLRVVESQSVHELRRAGPCCISPDPMQIFMKFGNARAVVCLFCGSQCTFQMAQLRVAVEHVLNRQLIGGRRLLGNVGNHQPRLDLQIAGILVQFAQQQCEQTGFS